MVRAHPLQNVYFNILAGSNWKDRFDVDYWGLSNRQGLEYIAKNDQRSLIKVIAGSNLALDGALRILKPADRARIIDIEWMGDADYIITNYRNNLVAAILEPRDNAGSIKAAGICQNNFFHHTTPFLIKYIKKP